MSLKQFLHRNQAGDTIVEVMVVLAVLSLALGISYATADRSLLDSRQANQNSQATALLQSQIENLRTLAPNPSTDASGYIFNAGQDFCIDSSGDVAPTTSALPSSSCAFDVFGNSIPTQILIDYQQTAGVTGGTFNLYASWPNIDGQGSDTVTLSYRLYQ
jgi:prepilin-type N-terminal cleavage/methylation domain-containing protein